MGKGETWEGRAGGGKRGAKRRGADCAAVGGSGTDTRLPAEWPCVHGSPRVHARVHAHALREAVFFFGGGG